MDPSRAATPAPPDDDAALLARVRERVLLGIAGDAGGHRTVRGGEAGWEEVFPGLRRKILHAADGAVSSLLRLDAGAVVPGHMHAMDEECLVLEGVVHIGEDVVLQAGDFHVARRGVWHADASTPTGALLYLRGAAPCRPGT